MFLRLQAYERPGDLVEALQLLRRPAYRPLAGGTAAVGPVDAETVGVVDLSGLGLRFQRLELDGLLLGAMTTLGELLRLPELLLAGGNVLGQAVERTGPPSLLARATLGGSLARPDRAPELVTALLALDARLRLVRLDGGGQLVREEVGLTADRAGALIEAVRIPVRPVLTAYERVARTPRDLATVAVIVAMAAEGGVMRDVRVAASGLAPRPVRLGAVEALLEGEEPTEMLLAKVADVGLSTPPPGDLRGSSEYRTHLAGVLTRRAVAAVAVRLGRM